MLELGWFESYSSQGLLSVTEILKINAYNDIPDDECNVVEMSIVKCFQFSEFLLFST